MSHPLSIEPVPRESLPPALAEALRPRIERLGYLGEFFTCAAHQPDALLSFMEFTEALKHAVAQNHSELVALTVATTYGNDYERHQHERLATKLGFSRGWIREVEQLAPERARELSDIEQRVQSVVLQLVADAGRVPAETIRTFVDAVGEPEAVAILMLTARYVAHALLSNAFGVRPPVPSIFDEEPDSD